MAYGLDRTLHYARRNMDGRKHAVCAQSGFSLIETIVASALLAVALTGVTQLFAVSMHATVMARQRSTAMILATQKMEELRGLTWTYDAAGSPVSDPGLGPSPPGTLRHTTDGYVDYVDLNGNLLGGGLVAPKGTSFVRHWSVESLPSGQNALVLQVVVRPLPVRESSHSSSASGEGWLLNIKTRKTK